MASICHVDWDDCYRIATNKEPTDYVLFDVAQGPDGWYFSVDIDCNSGGFTHALLRDIGPFVANKDTALRAAFDSALDWFWVNEYACDDLEIDSRLAYFGVVATRAGQWRWLTNWRCL